MSSVHIKFSGLDENSGVIFLQFATDETLHIIDQGAIHGFFPSQYKTYEINELLPLMAKFGHQVLSQQSLPNENKFTQEQINSFNQFIGTTQTIPINFIPKQTLLDQSNTHNLDSIKNPNSQVDQMRSIVLEVLAEEGLILGKVK